MAVDLDDEFASITESAPLVAEVRRRIEHGGPITFRDFMDTALYDSQHGYYSTHAAAMSRTGDYVTSPELHPVFGTLIAKQIIELWEAMARPARFDILELGGGRGVLARDLLSRAGREPEFASALRYRMLEISEPLVRTQRETLGGALASGANIDWLDDVPHEIAGIVLSNEFFDALPVHRVCRQGPALREVYVTHNGRRFSDVLGDPSTSALQAYFASLGVLPGEECLAEVNLDAVRWQSRIAAALSRGALLTFDYGYDAESLYAPWRRDGTLLCFFRQGASSDPYARVGMQDITSSIDFTTLRRAGEAAGLQTIGFTDQASFLLRLGLAEGLAAVAADEPQLEEYLARRNVVLDLIDPGRLGRIKVLLQTRDVPSTSFTGFRED